MADKYGFSTCRIDGEVYNHVYENAKPFESFSGCLRRLLGLPRRKRVFGRRKTKMRRRVIKEEERANPEQTTDGVS